jgi:hypothetical protein
MDQTQSLSQFRLGLTHMFPSSSTLDESFYDKMGWMYVTVHHSVSMDVIGLLVLGLGLIAGGLLYG